MCILPLFLLQKKSGKILTDIFTSNTEIMTPSFKPAFICYEQLASTNQEMKQLLTQKHLEEGTIIITQYQNAGRGQAGNTWESEKEKNLTFSLLLRPTFLEPHKQFYISKIISLAIIDTIHELTRGISIKWPNDIYIDDKKLAGILIENSIIGSQLDYCIIGIGLNVNQVKFLSDAPNPVSLKTITHTNHNLTKLVEKLIKNIQTRYDELYKGKEENIDNNYFRLLYRNSGIHTFKDQSGQFKASIKSINPMGMLTLEDENGKLREYAFKEVEFVQEDNNKNEKLEA